MRLYVLRHGQAQNGNKDFKRGLTEKGIEQIKSVKSNGLIPENMEVWSSSAQRTLESSKILFTEKQVKYIDDLYLASSQEILKMIWTSNITTDLLIIGHNPGLSDLANYFLDDNISMSTGELIGINFENLQLNETSRGTGTRIFF